MKVAHKVVRPSPSSQIAVISCHGYQLHQLLMVGVNKHIMICPKFQANHIQNLHLVFLSHFWKQQEDLDITLARTQEAYAWGCNSMQNNQTVIPASGKDSQRAETGSWQAPPYHCHSHELLPHSSISAIEDM